MKIETLKRSHLKRNIIIGVFAVAVISAAILNFTRAKYRVTQSIPLVTGTINYKLADLNVIAMYQVNESGGYDSIDTVPDSGYVLNEEESYCEIDREKDDSITMIYENGVVNIGVKEKGTKCYLYFDEGGLLSGNLAESIIANAGTDQILNDDTSAQNPRFVGADPDNYVYFNCDDYNNPSSSTCELWRIIGVFSEDTHVRSGEKLVKLIRDESIGSYAWDSGDVNDWTTASLQKSLNGSYLSGTTLGSGKGITSATNNMIETVTWKLGESSTYNDVTASMFYERERGTTTWKGKIGLMYPSDYGYATSGGSTTNRSSCLAKELFNWDSSSDCKNNDWLYDSGTTQWTLTPLSSSTGYVFGVTNDGIVGNRHIALNRNAVRPSIYLKSNIAISSGTGLSSNPYTLTD